MPPALRSLLTNILDYAGLFPPAGLAMEPAIRNYARYLRSPDRWMLGRFICPAVRLGELQPFVDELFSNSPEPLTISVLGRGGKDEPSLLSGWRSDLDEITAFRRQVGGRAVIDVMETRIVGTESNTLTYLGALSHQAADAGVRLFCEVPWTASFQQVARAAADALAARGLGFKLRTGGVEAAAFPPVRVIAEAIVACRDAKCPLKFTAGLHHPFRAFNASVQTKMHGFLNVFAAGVLAHTHGMDVHGVSLILDSESSADFAFDDYTLRWKTLNATRQRIEQCRRDGLISFGSCSFDEPREDLASLGLLRVLTPRA